MSLTQKILLFVLVLSASILAADVTIVLKNGSVFKGEIISDVGNFITLNSNGAPVRVLKSIIATLDGASYPPSAPAPTKPDLSGLVEITMKNGTVYRGTVVESDFDMVILNVDGASIRIPEEGIASKKPVSETRLVAPEPMQETATAPPASVATGVEKAATPEPAGPKPIEAGSDHTVTLKNGSSFTGTILSENTNFFCFRINTSKVNILKTMIAQLDGAAFVQAGGAPQPPAPQPAPNPVPPVAQPVVTAPAPAAPVVAPASAAPTPAPTISPAVAAPSQAPSAQTIPSTPVTPPAKQAVAPISPTVAATTAAPLLERAKPDTSRAALSAPVQSKPSAAPTPTIAPAAQPAQTEKREPASVAGAAALPAVKEGATKASPIQPDTVAKPAPVATAPSVRPPVPSPLVEVGKSDPEMSEAYRRIVFALSAANQGAQAASAIPRLIELLGDETPYKPTSKEKKKFKVDSLEGKSPARAARYGLTMLDTIAVVPLMEAMNIRNQSIRANAAWALGEIKDARSIDVLLNGVKDSSAVVRGRSSEALGKIRDPRSIPVLLTLLGSDTSEVVRDVTQQALNNLTDIPTLIEGLHDSHKLVRDNVSYILFLMTAQDFRSDPLKWESWWKEQHMLPDSAPEPAEDKKHKEKKKSSR